MGETEPDSNMRTEADRIAAYLLGELSEADQRMIEDRSFADDAFFDRLEFAEDELIDAYVRGDLGGDERSRFERHFLQSPRRKQRLEIALALAEHFGGRAAQSVRRSWLTRIGERAGSLGRHRGLTPAACVLTLVFAGLSSWLATTLRNEREFAEVQRRLAEQQITQLQGQIAQATPPPTDTTPCAGPNAGDCHIRPGARLTARPHRTNVDHPRANRERQSDSAKCCRDYARKVRGVTAK